MVIANQDPTKPVAPTKEQLEEASKIAGVKLVPEADLLAIKGSLGDKLTKAEEAANTANAAAEAAKANLSETQQKTYNLEARIKELEETTKQTASQKEELATAKKELEDTKKSVEGLNTKVLESQRRLVVATYGVKPETVKDKTLEQLAAFEEALKAIGAGKGIGNLAVGAQPIGSAAEAKSARELMAAGFEELHTKK